MYLIESKYRTLEAARAVDTPAVVAVYAGRAVRYFTSYVDAVHYAGKLQRWFSSSQVRLRLHV